jgi:hypothetical protein
VLLANTINPGGVTGAAHSFKKTDALAVAGVTGGWRSRLPHTSTTRLRKYPWEPKPPAHKQHVQDRQETLGLEQQAARLLLPRPWAPCAAASKASCTQSLQRLHVDKLVL